MIDRFRTIHAWLGGTRERDVMTRLASEAGRQIVFMSDRELDDGLDAVEVLVIGVAPRVDWGRAKRLVLLQTLGSGTDTLWPAAGLRESVLVANTRGVHVPEMRDHALALILAFERDLFRFGEAQQSRTWSTRPVGSIHGKTLAILGLGAVGSAIAESARTLGMRVISARASVPYVLDEVLAPADYVVVTLPLTPATRGMMGARALATMKDSAVLVAMSRGGIVDEVALLEALTTNALRGAALDVFEEEPLSKASPLWDAPRLVITPHVAGLTPDYLERCMAVALDNIARVARGELPSTLVDRVRGH